MKQDIKLFVGAMSKNCVDAVLEIKNVENKIGFISSRRQIDYQSGYVNNWSTQEYAKYVKSKNKNLVICRDHGGPNQGIYQDSGEASFSNDAKYLDIIHIDPWKKYQNIDEGTDYTIEMIKYISNINKNIYFEIGTEESIRKFTTKELEYFLKKLKTKLNNVQFSKILYCVIQSGVGLNLIEMQNTGTFSEKRLVEMINVCNDYNVKSKEHNSDYLSKEQLDLRFNLGLDAANIAPELGQIESLVYLSKCDESLMESFYSECFKSNKWKKWVSSDFNPTKNKKKLIQVCGHYIFSQKFCSENFKQADIVKENIKKRINSLIS